MWIFTPLDTFHVPFVHADASAQLMESVEMAAAFLVKKRKKKLWVCHTFEFPSGNWLQHCSAQTSRWHKRSYSAMQISEEEIWGSVQWVCSEAWQGEAKNISFQCFKCSFIYLIGRGEAVAGRLRKIVTVEMTVHQGGCNVFEPTLKANWC